MPSPRRPLLLASTLFVLLAFPVDAQISGSISGFCSQNGNTTNLNPSLTQPTVTVYDCVTLGIPYTAGLVSLQLMTTGTLCEGMDAILDVTAVSTPEDLVTWGITNIANLNPPFPIGPCPPTAIINYGKHNGSADLYSFSIGSLFSNGPIITKHIESEMTWTDTLMVTSGGANNIAMPVGISGSIFAAESFGTSATQGYVKLTVSGTVGGAAVSETIEVTSVSVIPEQKSINVSHLLPVALAPGVTTVSVNLTAKAEVTTTAQGAGFIAGSATAGVSFPNSITFGRFVAADGSPLPADIHIESAVNGAIYEDTTRNRRWVDMGFSLPGSAGVPQLVGTGPLSGGQTSTVSLSSAAPNAPILLGIGYDALYLLFGGGVIVPMAIAPGTIKPLTSDGLGLASLTFTVPPGLPPGFQAYFQAWVFDPAGPSGFLAASNAIQATTPR